MPPRPSLRWSPMSPSGFFLALLLTSLVLVARAAEVAPRMLLLAGAQVAPATFIAVGERTTILRSTDAARTWQAATIPPGFTATLTAVSFAPDGQHGWVVGHDALILTTADSGLTWQKSWQGENLADSFLDVLALDARHILAVGAYGLCLETTDAGHTWMRRKLTPDDYHFNRLTRGPTGTLYLAGEHGTLLRSADSGATWQSIESPYDGSFYGIIPLDAQTLLAHGLRGRLYRSADDGKSWQMIALADRVLLATALQLKSGTLLFAGQARAFYISRDAGRTVTALPVPFTTAVAALLELPEGRVLALGEAGATVFEPTLGIPTPPPAPALAR
jgi:photosystem II stability/assembly factor-like uncharacterized protein